MLTGLLFLFGAFLVGTGLVRRAFLRLLSHAEQVMWGLVAGWMLATLVAYGVARLAGRLAWWPMMAVVVLVWIAATLLWLPTARRVGQTAARHELRRMLRSLWRTDYAGLLLVLLLFAPIFVTLFSTRMLHAGADGLYSGGSTWYDLGWHTAITTSFLYGQNFPPIYTPFPPAPLLYPFLPDFQTALLVCLGMETRAALLLTALPLALAITGLFYAFARRLLDAQAFSATRAVAPQTAETGERAGGDSFGRLPAQTTGVVATMLFLLNGGLGFLYFFEHWRTSKKSFREFWASLDVNYANMGGEQIQWTNLITDTMLPQRTSLYGLSSALIICTLFVLAWRSWTTEAEAQPSAGNDDGGKRDWTALRKNAERAWRSWLAGWRRWREHWTSWRLLLPAGILTGLLPLFHTHSYLAVGLLSGFLFILRPRRAWLAFWLPAVLLALPQFLNLSGHVASQGFMRWQPGWRGHNAVNWPLYWLRNIGLPLLLIFPAWASAPRRWRKFYLAFACLLVTSLLVVFSPNDYDNIKLMYYWHAATSVFVAAWLMRLAFVDGQRFLAALLILLSIASGLLAIRYEELSYKNIFTGEEMQAAAFVKERTAPRTLFLTAPVIHQPILSLAGRAVLRGDTAWLWSHGYDFPTREADVKRIYAGASDALELLRYYKIDYVYLSEDEKKDLYANQEFFDRTFPLCYQSERIRIYDTRALHADANDRDASADTRHALALPPPREYAARLATDPFQLLVEFPRASFAVYRFYKISYGRMPKYYELMTDAAIVGRGVYVGQAGWQEILENNKRKLTEAWMNRPEFKTLYEGRTNAEFVDALYANAALKPAASERNPLVEKLDAGQETRAAILRHIAENRQLYRQEYNRAFVLMHYFGYLHRNPDDPPDNNLDGFNFWLTDLDKTGDYRSMSRVFIESGEYKDQIKK